MYKKHKKQKNGLAFCNSPQERVALWDNIKSKVQDIERIWDAKILITKYDKFLYGR